MSVKHLLKPSEFNTQNCWLFYFPSCSLFATLHLQSSLVSGSSLSEIHVLLFVFFPLAKNTQDSFCPECPCMTQSLDWETGSILVPLFSITPHPQCLPARVISGPIALVWAHSLLILKFPTFFKNRFHTGALKNNILRITDGNEARGERESKRALRYKLTLQTHLLSSFEKGGRICMSPQTCLCKHIKIVSFWWILRKWKTVFRLFSALKVDILSSQHCRIVETKA